MRYAAVELRSPAIGALRALFRASEPGRRLKVMETTFILEIYNISYVNLINTMNGRYLSFDSPTSAKSEERQMLKKLPLISGFALVCLASQAMADMTTIGCRGYIVGITDDVAIQGEIATGTRTAFESEVCSRSAELAEGINTTTTRPVFIEEMGITTRVLIIPTSDDS